MLNLIWKNFKPLQKNNVANTLLPWTSPSWVTEFIWSFPIIKGIIYCPCVCGLCVSTRVCVCACVCPRPEVDIEVSSLHLMFWARVSLCLELTGETGYKKKKHLHIFFVSSSFSIAVAAFLMKWILCPDQSSSDAAYLARHVGLRVGVPTETGALTLNRLCGSGFQSIVSGCQVRTASLPTLWVGR